MGQSSSKLSVLPCPSSSYSHGTDRMVEWLFEDSFMAPGERHITYFVQLKQYPPGCSTHSNPEYNVFIDGSLSLTARIMGLGIKGVKMEVVFIMIPNDPLGKFYYTCPAVTKQVFV